MKTIDALPGIGLEHLGPIFDEATATEYAWELSNFMRDQVHGPVYEAAVNKGGFGLEFIKTSGAPSGTPGDIEWRVEAMRENNVALPPAPPDHPNGTFREYIIARRLDSDGTTIKGRTALAGLLVVTKPQGACTADVHQPSYIAEIDVAQDMYGTKLPLHLLNALRETHREDPYVDMEAYRHNLRSQRFHGKLGFVFDNDTPPRDGTVYKGKWIRMHTTGAVFAERLQALLG